MCESDWVLYAADGGVIGCGVVPAARRCSDNCSGGGFRDMVDEGLHEAAG